MPASALQAHDRNRATSCKEAPLWGPAAEGFGLPSLYDNLAGKASFQWADPIGSVAHGPGVLPDPPRRASTELLGGPVAPHLSPQGGFSAALEYTRSSWVRPAMVTGLDQTKRLSRTNWGEG